MDEQLTRELLAEIDERVEALFGDIRDWRARRVEGRERRELVARIFRHVHTIKGSSAAAGVEGVARLAHEFETLLDAARAGRVSPDDELLEAFEAAVEALSAGVSAAAVGSPAGDNDRLISRLRALADAGPGAGRREDLPDDLPADLAAALGEPERRRIAEAVAEGARLFVVSADFGLEDFDQRVRELSDALAEAGEVISTIPGMSTAAPDRINFLIPYATRETLEKIMQVVAPFGATLRAEPREEARGGTIAEPHRVDEVDSVDDEADGVGSDSYSSAHAAALSQLTMLVRVPLEELDELISETHGLYNETARALALALEGLPPGPARANLEARAPSLLSRFSELEGRLIGMRMVPVRATLERAARAGAGAARETGREVEFETRGGDVRLDKSLAEAASDPLLHLVRNAVDHGVEPPEERRAAGKPARGRVLVEAVADGGHVFLRVTDDGRGIDPERVARTAREGGHIRPGDALTESQATRLIFRPGFSTAGKLSSVSGRGVGLDVVERAVEAAGGEMRVWSRRGEGTSFEMRLPTTLALVASLVVRAGGESYCIASAHVEDVAGAGDSDIESRDGVRSVRWRGEALPLVTLGALLGLGAGDREEARDSTLIVSRLAARGEGRVPHRAAVLIDGVEDRGEVLVGSLGRHAARWRGVSGAAELRDGAVALVLDLPRLLEMHF